MGLISWLFGEEKSSPHTKPKESNLGINSHEQKANQDGNRIHEDSAAPLKSSHVQEHSDLSEPRELGVRQKIEVANCLYSQTCLAVVSSWKNVFEKMFPTPKGTPNQVFVLCMQAAVAWLVMRSYDFSHEKGRTAQLMFWLELASCSKLFPLMVSDMNSSKFEVKPGVDAGYNEKMNAKYDGYSNWVNSVMKKYGMDIDVNIIREELVKAQKFVQFWYNDCLVQAIKKQLPGEPVVPRDCTPGSMELNWIATREAAIAQAKW